MAEQQKDSAMIEPLAAQHPGVATSVKDPDEIQWDMLSSVRRIYNGKLLLLLTTLGGCLLGLVLTFIIHPWYSASAVFLPPKNADLLTPVAPIVFGATDSSDLYLGMLMSGSVADDVIDRVGLMSVYNAKMRSDAKAALAGASNFSVSKNSLIEVRVKARSPELAASIANAYLEALYRLNGQMVASGSIHRRIFYEEQLQEQRKALTQAETDLKMAQERTGVVSPQGEAQAGINATAQLQAQIGAAEARIAGLLTGATERNPEVVQARSELNQLRAELASQQASSTRSGGIASSSRLPGLALDLEQKSREVKLRETEYELLVAQYEKARLSSIDPGPQLQIVDRAHPPERKSGPSRRIFVVVGFLVGLLAGLGYLLAADPLRRLRGSLQSAPGPRG
jgi:tyrosine-protein kinase Etk/Wzc